MLRTTNNPIILLKQRIESIIKKTFINHITITIVNKHLYTSQRYQKYIAENVIQIKLILY